MYNGLNDTYNGDLFFTTTLDDVPVMVTSDDFYEFLKDSGYNKEIEMEDLMMALDDWLED
jgi:hypothetical protein